MDQRYVRRSIWKMNYAVAVIYLVIVSINYGKTDLSSIIYWSYS